MTSRETNRLSGVTFGLVLPVILLFAPPAHAQQVQSLEHDPLDARHSSLVQVDADTLALAYGGDGGDGYIKTFTVSADGSSITQVQVLEHDTLLGSYSSLVQVDADTFALAYAGDGGGGRIKTFTVSADGSSITQIQLLEHDAFSGAYNSLVQVDADTYALAYRGLANDGYIKTFTISADGSSITQVQSLEHDGFLGVYNSLVQVDADTYALAYTGDGNDGYIKTFTIPSDGSSITQVQSLEHDPGVGIYNSLVQVDANTYALAYGGVDNAGYIKTFTISADGSSITQVESLEHDPSLGLDNSFVRVDADTYALAYRGLGDDGYLRTFTISADGLSITQVESLEHDTILAVEHSLVQVDADTYALAYGGEDTDGYIKTFTISGVGGLPVELMGFAVE